MSTEVGRIDLGLDINKKVFNNQLSGIAGGAEKQVKSAFGGISKWFIRSSRRGEYYRTYSRQEI